MPATIYDALTDMRARAANDHELGQRFEAAARYFLKNDPFYRSRFTGYRCSHDLKLSFDLDMDRLSAVLSSLSACSARPQFSIRFTVRDPDAVYDELLRSAAENARAKAEVLCAASGAKLGDLLHIRYGRNESDVYSRTNMMFACDEAAPRAKGMSIRPDDIHLSDTVTFIWAIGS